MAHLRGADESAPGFFDENDDVVIPSQEVWPNGFHYLGRGVDLGIGLLNSHDPFDQQNRNIDVALHAFEIPDEFITAFPSSQDHPNISASGPSIPEAPAEYTGLVEITQSQQYRPMQSAQNLGPGEASIFPIELSNAFPGVRDFQVIKPEIIPE